MAMKLTRDAGIDNRKQYWKWHVDNSLGYLPKMPNRVYKEWDSWNAFLGNTNSFEKTLARNRKAFLDGSERFLPYWEALRKAQSIAADNDLQNRHQWYEWHDRVKPVDLPKRPNQVYEEASWITWLGKGLLGKVEAAANTVGVMGLVGVEDQPSNVLKIVIYRGGYAELIENEVDVRKLYEVETSDDIQTLHDYVSYYGSKQNDGSWIIGNVNELYYELDNVLLMYVKRKGVGKL